MKNTPTFHFHILAISAILFSLLLSSCTVYYSTSDIKKTFRESQNKMNKALGQIARDRRVKHDIYNQLMRNISDSTLTPYPELSNELDHMAQSFAKLKQTTKHMEQLKANLNRLVKGRKKIEGKSSLWDEFQLIQKEYDAQTETFESLNNDYSKSSNKFIDLLEKYQISNIKVVEIQKQVSKYLMEVNQSVQHISDEIVKYRQNTGDNQKLLTQLESILTSLKSDQKDLEAMINEFEEEVGDEPMIWSGPGMKSHSILGEMKERSEKISAQRIAFNKLVSGL